MDHHLAAASSGRFSSSRDREEEEAEAEGDASNNSSPTTSTPREISFMPAAASSSSSAAASTSASGASSSGAAAAEPAAVEKEHMFDKVVTPSDVGKLNRLVIPKQYAEKYFPLGSAPGSEKGLLLTFEDTSSSGSGNNNKHWRFRYSYWNSSQSYVMTKGWSRFVKEKRLVAGDTVSFSRGASADARGRLFIDWKRRVDARGPLLRFPHTLMPLAAPWASFGAGAGGGFFMPPSPPATLYEHHRLRQGGLDFRSAMTMSGMTYPPPAVGRQQQLLFFGSARTMMMPPLHHPPRAPPALPLHYAVQPSAAAAARPLVLDSVPVIESPTTAAKRVRLFGVNLDNNPRSSSDDGAGEASHQQQGNNNALSTLQTMPAAGWQQRTLRLLELPRHGHGHGGAESSAASSPSSSSSSKREARSSAALDLDL